MNSCSCLNESYSVPTTQSDEKYETNTQQDHGEEYNGGDETRM